MEKSAPTSAPPAEHRDGPRGPAARSHASRGPASADAVESLRRLVRDLKHDVRMLRVITDRQSALIARLAEQVEHR